MKYVQYKYTKLVIDHVTPCCFILGAASLATATWTIYPVREPSVANISHLKLPVLHRLVYHIIPGYNFTSFHIINFSGMRKCAVVEWTVASACDSEERWLPRGRVHDLPEEGSRFNYWHL